MYVRPKLTFVSFFYVFFAPSPNLILKCLRLKLVSKPGQVDQLLSLSLIAAQATKLGMEVSKLAGAALQGLPCSLAGSSPWAGVRQQVFPSTSGSGNG